MPTIHLQTELGHQTAMLLKQNASMALEQVRSLKHAMGELESTWQGNAQMEFVHESTSVLSQIQSQLSALEILAGRLENEVNEWEQVDRSGAAGLRDTVSGGQGFAASSAGSMTVAFASLVTGLPAWLALFLFRFFPEPSIVSPLADEQPAPQPKEGTVAPSQKSKLGELLEKAEKERQEQEKLAQENEKLVEIPKPRYIHQYPSREDDGTYLVGQEKDDSCSMASTKMALERATGVEAKESDLRDASSALDDGYEKNDSKWGTNPSTLDDLVNNEYGDVASANYNYPESQTVSNLETASGEGNGIVVSVKNSEWFGSANAHSVSVVGVTTENGQKVVLINDPWPPGEGKRLSVPVEDFEKAWYGDAMYITKKNKE